MENNLNTNRGITLSKALGRTDIIAIGFGTMVGWGWVMMAPTWITEAGFFGAIIAFLMGGGIVLLIGNIYGELTSALPLAGGEFVFAYRAMGKTMGFFVGWIMVLSYLGVAAWESIALSTAINYILPIPNFGHILEVAGYNVYLSWAIVGSAGALIIMVLNYFGTKIALIFQVMATAALIAVAIIILLGGVTFGDISNIGETFTSGSGLLYVFFMVPAMMVGFDVVPQSAEEMNIAPKDIGRMIVVCIVISLAWYIAIIVGVGFAAPVEIRTTGIIPMADVTAYMFNSELFSIVIVFCGILGILTTWNGFFMGASRLIFAMGRAGVLPKVFGSVHKKHKSPWVAVLFVGGVCMLSPLLGRNALVWLINTSSLCALIAYCFVIISFLVLRREDKELDRPYRLRNGRVFGAVTLVLAGAYLIVYIGTNFSLSKINPEFAITFFWLVIGFLLALGTAVRGRTVEPGEMELLIFGERFARKEKRHE